VLSQSPNARGLGHPLSYWIEMAESGLCFPTLSAKVAERMGTPSSYFSYIASGLSMPRSASERINARSVTAAVASRNVFRCGSSSVRMW
jgi:hypothetical protein